LKEKVEAASIILAAGRGTRIKGFEGNKTLLPLVPSESPYDGTHPILLNILQNLPHGPKALVVNHRKEELIERTQGLGLMYYEQLILNGTGGALLAAHSFLDTQDCDRIIITMGDIPLVRKSTYISLSDHLKDKSLVVLGFRPSSKKQYGLLDIHGEHIRRIIEWTYWKAKTKGEQLKYAVCNSGIYAARRNDLQNYLPLLSKRPHRVFKERNGRPFEYDEFFVTDLVEYMSQDGLSVGYLIADEEEVLGVDDLPALKEAQYLFQKGNK
jgi:bifunctional UDP-N-acetylglucosamine pyrophosphorylase/glucosamine-1-phosphate N-acetyltransferase